MCLSTDIYCTLTNLLKLRWKYHFSSSVHSMGCNWVTVRLRGRVQRSTIPHYHKQTSYKQMMEEGEWEKEVMVWPPTSWVMLITEHQVGGGLITRVSAGLCCCCSAIWQRATWNNKSHDMCCRKTERNIFHVQPSFLGQLCNSPFFGMEPA